MPKPLSIDKAVDGNLKPVKDSDGTVTALEVSTDNVRVKNLVVAGKVEGSLEVDTITAEADFTLDVAGNITLDTDGGSVTITDTTPTAYYPSLLLKSTDTGANGAIMIFTHDSASPASGDDLGTIYFYGDNDNGDATNYAIITVEIKDEADGSEEGKIIFQMQHGAGVAAGFTLSGNSGKIDAAIGYGAASMTTIVGDLDIDGDTITTAGAISLDSGGAITLDAHDGAFIAKNAGTQFSAANSAYAGMILGYTVIGLDATPATFDVTNAMLPVHDDLKVSFTFPPSGKVEIMASIYIQTDAARAVTFGLSTTDASTGFTSLGAKYENHTHFADETDGTQHSHRWYVTGTAGDAEELWFAAGTTQAGRIDLFWGGDSSAVADSTHPIEYQPFVMKATALPETIYTG